MILVAFTGFAGAGKSTMARLGYAAFGGVRLSFAAPMKAAVARLFPEWPPEALYGPSAERERPINGITPRRALQTLGSWGRDLAPRLWVDRAIKPLLLGPPTTALGWFDDLRYPNEAEAILACGGHVIYLDAPEAEPPWYRQAAPWGWLHEATGGRLGMHPSEAGVLDVRRDPRVVRVRRRALSVDTWAAIEGYLRSLGLPGSATGGPRPAG